MEGKNMIMKYKLKQETPMIHFQYDESGAIIRASELKPKLDKFIIEWCKRNNIEINEGWKIKAEDGVSAFDYKVRIEANGEPEISQDYNLKMENSRNKDINALYFGNMGDETDSYKETVFYKEEIDLTIICLISALRDVISRCLEEFFVVTNFGTRQSKGFGSFRLSGSKGNPLDMLNKAGYLYFYADLSNGIKDEKQRPNESLNVILAIAAVMKGGMNFSFRGPDKYLKGYIQRQYLEDIGKSKVGSDKAFIKSKLITGKSQNEKGNDYQDYEFVRALLGLADHYEFRDKERKGTVTTVDEESDIKRFKSPITFTVYGKYVIGIMNDSYKSILGKEFVFEYGKKTENIRVPKSFDAKKFIIDFVEYYNSNDVKKRLNNIASVGKDYKIGAGVTLKKGGSL